MKLRVICTGTRPLLMNNVQTASPLNPYAKKLKTLNAKRVKTDDDRWQMARVEFEGAMYYNPELGPAVEKIRSADRTQLTHEQAARLDSLGAMIARQAGMLARLSKRDEERAAELRKLRRDTAGDIAHLGDQVAKLHEALKRHGFSLDEDDSSQEHRIAG